MCAGIVLSFKIEFNIADNSSQLISARSQVKIVLVRTCVERSIGFQLIVVLVINLFMKTPVVSEVELE